MGFRRNYIHFGSADDQRIVKSFSKEGERFRIDVEHAAICRWTRFVSGGRNNTTRRREFFIEWKFSRTNKAETSFTESFSGYPRLELIGDGIFDWENTKAHGFEAFAWKSSEGAQRAIIYSRLSETIRSQNTSRPIQTGQSLDKSRSLVVRFVVLGAVEDVDVRLPTLAEVEVVSAQRELVGQWLEVVHAATDFDYVAVAEQHLPVVEVCRQIRVQINVLFGEAFSDMPQALLLFGVGAFVFVCGDFNALQVPTLAHSQFTEHN